MTWALLPEVALFAAAAAAAAAALAAKAHGGAHALAMTFEENQVNAMAFERY